ncbi:hypothetical protein EDB85DRAFT_1997949 [Lactarius pseudohatsudake]|nr:hypothetical protein EDB85DRAFT_1997949 [Lactarius pseudohatsudake]
MGLTVVSLFIIGTCNWTPGVRRQSRNNPVVDSVTEARVQAADRFDPVDGSHDRSVPFLRTLFDLAQMIGVRSMRCPSFLPICPTYGLFSSMTTSWHRQLTYFVLPMT